MNISDRIKTIRKKYELSQVELAKKIGVSSGNIGDWESERSKPATNALIAFTENFGISIDWLLTGDGEMFKCRSSEIQEDETLTLDEEIVLDYFRSLTKSEKKDLLKTAASATVDKDKRPTSKLSTSKISDSGEETATLEKHVG